MYSVLNYGEMACEAPRMAAYARAIAQTVKEGSVVLDIGAGSGILSLLAARAGARRVHAVDPNPALFLLSDIAAENGLADRLVIHPTSSLDLVLPEKVDVIVSDLRGAFPLHEHHTEILRDARERFLLPTGTILPLRDRLFVAAVESGGIADKVAKGWEGFERHGLSARAARTSVLNTAHSDKLKPLSEDDLVSSAEAWATIEYASYSGGVIDGHVTLPTRRAGMAHGLAIWFEATIVEGATFTTGPGYRGVYGSTFLPFLEPVAFREGDCAHVILRVDERGRRWAWDTVVEAQNGSRLAAFRQTTFLGLPASREAMLRASTNFRPVRSSKGDRVARILSLMDGVRTVAEIVEQVAIAESSASSDALLDDVRVTVTRYAS